MYIKEEILSNLSNSLEKFLVNKGIKDPSVVFEKPVDFSFGDVTTSFSLKYSKQLKIDPIALAGEARAVINSASFIEKVDIVKPGYINVHFTSAFYFGNLKEILKLGSEYGSNNSLSGNKIVVEHTSPNPNKALHLGHLRNNFIGMSLIRALKLNGAKVLSDAINNNKGIAIAKTMYGFLKHKRKSDSTAIDVEYFVNNKNKWKTPEDEGIKPDLFISNCYTLSQKDYENEEEQKRIKQLVVDWERGDKNTLTLWRHVLNYAYTGRDRVLERLGSCWDKVWNEHDHYQLGKEYIQYGVEKDIFEKLDDGAVLSKLDDYSLPNTILLKNDGTSLYITQDIALTAKKVKYYAADKYIWIVGSDQGLAMKQVFAICEQLNIGNNNKFLHLPYGYVGLKGGGEKFVKMSSREGTAVLIDDILDSTKALILERFKLENIKIDERVESVSEKLAIAAVKFSFLKGDKMNSISFDISESISISGASGVYLEYTHARAKSVLKKGRGLKKGFFARFFSGDSFSTPPYVDKEKTLLKHLSIYPSVISKTKEDYSIHSVSQYLLSLSSQFNSWYSDEKILDGSKLEGYKLSIVEAVSIVLRNGLEVLGIEAVDKI